jgi:hypothetical protein
MLKILLGLTTLILISCGSQNLHSNDTTQLSDKMFEWDFSKKRKFVYSYYQTVNGENKMDKDRPANKTYLTGTGYLNVRVKENNLADLSITDLEIEMISFNKDGTPEDTTSNKSGNTVVQDMKPDGSFSDPNTNFLFDMLLPLPSISLKIGESEKIAMQVPFNANGSRLISKGFNKLTFTGYETIDNRKCAVLKGDLDVSILDVPEELKGEYRSATTGKATYYFDVENHYYVGADIQMRSEVMMDTETGDEDDFGMFMDMSSNNVFKIRLEKIEE